MKEIDDDKGREERKGEKRGKKGREGKKMDERRIKKTTKKKRTIG